MAGSVEEAGVIVINTCMVTGPTEAQCRKAIRRARRDNADAKLIVAGCLSTGSRDQLENMKEVDLVIEPSEKGDLPGLLGVQTFEKWKDWPEDPAVDMGHRDRGFLKVQDGCDSGCTFCIVPSVRGPSRSLRPERVVHSVRRLMHMGASEVVLSGIHLGQYGSDLDPVLGLEDLLNMLLYADLQGRLRLSSIEPLEITTGLAKILATSDGRICRHIHVPMQSGSDRILKAMGRPYRRDHFCEALSMLRESVPGIGIGCDVICGFPTESEKDFNLTRDLIEKFQIPFVHAFPYSPRPGTRAASLVDDVPHRIKKERVRHLIELAEANRKVFAASFVGSLLKTAMENRVDGQGRRLGLSDNYLQIAVREPDEGVIPGRLIDSLIERMDGDILEGHWARTRENG